MARIQLDSHQPFRWHFLAVWKSGKRPKQKSLAEKWGQRHRAEAHPFHRSLVFFVGVNVLRRQQQQQQHRRQQQQQQHSSAAAATLTALPCKLCRLLCCRSVAVVTVTAFGFCLPLPPYLTSAALSLSLCSIIGLTGSIALGTVSKFVGAARREEPRREWENFSFPQHTVGLWALAIHFHFLFSIFLALPSVPFRLYVNFSAFSPHLFLPLSWHNFSVVAVALVTYFICLRQRLPHGHPKATPEKPPNKVIHYPSPPSAKRVVEAERERKRGKSKNVFIFIGFAGSLVCVCVCVWALGHRTFFYVYPHTQLHWQTHPQMLGDEIYALHFRVFPLQSPQFPCPAPRLCLGTLKSHFFIDFSCSCPYNHRPQKGVANRKKGRANRL